MTFQTIYTQIQIEIIFQVFVRTLCLSLFHVQFAKYDSTRKDKFQSFPLIRFKKRFLTINISSEIHTMCVRTKKKRFSSPLALCHIQYSSILLLRQSLRIFQIINLSNHLHFNNFISEVLLDVVNEFLYYWRWI